MKVSALPQYIHLTSTSVTQCTIANIYQSALDYRLVFGVKIGLEQCRVYS